MNRRGSRSRLAGRSAVTKVGVPTYVTEPGPAAGGDFWNFAHQARIRVFLERACTNPPDFSGLPRKEG